MTLTTTLTMSSHTHSGYPGAHSPPQADVADDDAQLRLELGVLSTQLQPVYDEVEDAA